MWSDFCDWIKQSKVGKQKSPPTPLLSSSASVVEAAKRNEEAKSFWSVSKSWASCPSSLQEQVRKVFGIEVSGYVMPEVFGFIKLINVNIVCCFSHD